MQNLVRLAMEDGAYGVGSALIYPPGVYADANELAAITKPAGDAKGIYITHIRSEADQFLEALDEAIDIGKRAGTPVEIYHLKASGKRNWPKEAEALARIDAARAAGQDVGACMYPYTRRSHGADLRAAPRGQQLTASCSTTWPTLQLARESKPKWRWIRRTGRTWACSRVPKASC